MHKIIVGDVYAGLNELEDNSIDIAITSPPYWNQRDYGFEDQIGNEETPTLYIQKLNIIFQLLKKKMKNDAVFFLNIGDKYLSKYGKSSLGFIPYKLAYEMVKSGWFLSDIIIWFKPNHMPSSIKNRFTNSYEPVFVFSPNRENIYTEYQISSNDYSNILKINLQPTFYKHVAVFPEKLVESLLKKVKIREKVNILDPFAGSGTTLKVIKDLNLNATGIMIEKNIDYVEIIKERCKLNGNYNTFTPKHIYYTIEENNQNNKQLSIFENKIDYYNNNSKKGLLKVANSIEEYYEILNEFENQSIKFKYSQDAIFFIGSKELNLDMILDTASLTDKGWAIRNMIVVEEVSKWFPIFFIVDDNKRCNYIFNYEKLNLQSKTKYERDWSETNFIGYKVYDSVSKSKRTGVVIDVLEKLENFFPTYLLVRWSDGQITREYVIYDESFVNDNISIILEGNKIIIKEKEIFIDLDKEWKSDLKYFDISLSNFNKNKYNGKFSNEKRKNLGASPGARASTNEEYFSLQRLYNVNQNLVADYINYKRMEKGLTKSELTSKFPPNYKHTVGHWLRKDFGGSIPTPEDWFLLSKILDLDEEVTNYVCKTALKLQTVKHARLKPPRDFINVDFVEKLKLLYKV
ncbi:MAG: site-specific DNA-methyltransferase [Ignavibacterium sp.]|nr:site-specific DNA-methyltransferase [Ignavibacterium sp.]MDW8375724.1 site-specific DNA-methyltransferase [Ignavibacteriales bacterium]